MLGPPAVAWHVGKARWHRLLIATLAALGMVPPLYLANFTPLRELAGVLLLLVLFATGMAIWQYGQQAQGTLRWDGTHWHWSAWTDQPVGNLICTLDLQQCMLIRISNPSGESAWLWLESQRADSRWLALRRALVHAKDLSRGNELPTVG